MYTEQRVYSVEAAIGELDRRTASLGRLEARLANVERLAEAAADVNVLLTVLADPKATKARLESLQKATQEVAAGQAQLEAARIANERAFAETRADLDQRTAKLSEREIAARLQDANLREREAVIRASKPDPYPPNSNFFGTIRQEPYRE